MSETSSDDSDIVFWDDPMAESLTYKSKDEAIEMIIDGTYPDPPPDTIEVAAWKRRKVEPHFLSGDILEFVLERLDEEFGGEDGPEEPTEVMRAAEAEFIEKVLADYVPWQCEIVRTEVINTRDWLKEHKPDWYAEIYGESNDERQ